VTLVQCSSAFEWHKLFKETRKNVEDDERSGRPRSRSADENVEKVRNPVHSDNQRSLLCGNSEVVT